MLHIGHGSMVNASRIISIVPYGNPYGSAPIKRMIQGARETSFLIDATYGRRIRSVIITDSNHVIISTIESTTLNERLKQVRQ